ncbi:hypothetical protein KJ785_02280 [Patescibacteria group bacterium]|nr:hypothetical protein [Patescibacteria group bacterium]
MNENPIKTIRQIIEEYLTEQKKRLADRTLLSYRDAMNWLLCGLRRNSCTFLDEEELRLFEKREEQGIEFEDFFGSEVLDAVEFGCFLGYFLPRKTCVGREGAKKICGIVLHFYKWLVENSYVFDEDMEETIKNLREDFKISWQEYEERIEKYNESIKL